MRCVGYRDITLIVRHEPRINGGNVKFSRKETAVTIALQCLDLTLRRETIVINTD